MGLFSSVLGASRAFPSNEAEAVLGILVSVIAADGDISDEEVDSFTYLANNTKILGPMQSDVFSGHITTCLRLLKNDSPQVVMERCSVHLTEKTRKPLFINSCDLIMRDGRVEPDEEKLIEGLQKKLGIDDGFAQNVVSIILSKYAL